MSALYGVVAEFAAADAVREAARAARAAGYAAIDVFSPFPIEGLGELLELRPRLASVAFVGGLLGGAAIFLFAGWAQAIDWTLNIGGRRAFAVTAFLVPTYELTILFASLSAVVAMLARDGLPAPYHPLFEVAAFARASQDRFFLLVKASDPRFDAEAVRRFLAALEPLEVHDVPG